MLFGFAYIIFSEKWISRMFSVDSHIGLCIFSAPVYLHYIMAWWHYINSIIMIIIISSILFSVLFLLSVGCVPYYTFLFCIALQLNSDGQNEFVKSYLQQREQLMSQQMEDKKRYEGPGRRLHALVVKNFVKICRNNYGLDGWPDMWIL